MNFLNKMERKWGKYAISNLTFWLIGTYVVGFIIRYTMPAVQSMLTLEPYYILHGQIWRLVSWLLIPPGANLIFLIFFLACYYFIGTSIEQALGTFRYNVYLLGGILISIIAAFVLYGINYLVTGAPMLMGGYFQTTYVNMSLFLTFAVLFPNMEFRLYFLIPIKAKWMGILELLWVVLAFFGTNWAGKAAIIASLLNFLVFYFGTRNYKQISPKEIHRKQVYRQQMRQAAGATKHKCAVCGRTEKDGEDLEFRFCSKCDGNYEYCQDHLFTHKHNKSS
ncbi:MAG: hypothetical protein RSD28_06375 [Lachnospiraceae bacterium]